jgi:hypothetical protein
MNRIFYALSGPRRVLPGWVRVPGRGPIPPMVCCAEFTGFIRAGGRTVNYRRPALGKWAPSGCHARWHLAVRPARSDASVAR